MITQLPESGNQVIGPARLRATRRRRGIALISVVSVLVLLMIIATPFLLAMRDGAKRGENYRATGQVDAEAQSLFELAEAHLVAGIEHAERKRAESMQDVANPTDDATPASDVPAEFQLPASLLADFNRATEKEHRVWSLRIADAQAKFNLNSCSVGVLSNLLGRARLQGALTTSDETVSVDDASLFPEKDGVLRIGTELISYKLCDRKSGTFTGCTRGFEASRPENGAPAEHAAGAQVFNESAWQLATRAFRARPGTWVRYTNLYQARTIADLGITTLRAEDFDRARRWLTAWNGNVVGDGWCNPQVVNTAISASDKSSLLVTVRNIAYFGAGTVVRITDGLNEDFGIVVEVEGTNQLRLAADVRHDYDADRTRIYGLARAPLNVNTADTETLAIALEGVALRGKGTGLDRRRAWALAQYLKSWKDPAAPADRPGQPGVYRGWDDLVHGLEQARTTGLMDADEFEAVLRNALNANDSLLAFSTVPFTFRSWDVYEARATAVLMGRQGEQRARREMTRVFEVSSGRSATVVAESQADFQEQIRVSRDAKWFVTYPVNVNAYYDKGNEPASEYVAYAEKDRFPDEGTSPASGHAQLREAAFRFTRRGAADRYAHFDEEQDPRGFDLASKPFAMSIEGPYDANGRKADVIRTVTLPGQNEGIEIGLAPFACSFWYQPDWSADSREHVIFDYGSEEFLNRVALRWDGRRRLLVLSCADATREQLAAEVTCDFAADGVDWQPGRWYHIACTVYGCAPGMMELFIDAEKVGVAPLLTRLTANVLPTGDVFQLSVEDTTGFPQSGVLLLRAQEGVELFEYSSANDNTFTVSRRKARSIDKQLDPAQEPGRTHVVGETVELYGFAAPLLTDVRKGGATLAANLGPWRVFRARGNDTLQWSDTSGGSHVFPAGIGDFSAQGFQNDIFLTEWTTGNPADSATLDDLGPAGTRGLALLVSTGGDTNAAAGSIQVMSGGGGSNAPQDALIGGADIVLYEVGALDATNGLTVKLIQRHIALRHYDPNTLMTQTASGDPRFIPGYTYGGNQTYFSPVTGGQKIWTLDGWPTAFVPIAISGSGGGADYLDPADGEPQLASGTTPAAAYVQLESEWVKYDTYDSNLIQSQVVFYRDIRIPDIAQCLKLGVQGLAPVTATTGAGTGGSGGNGSNTAPPNAQDGNIESNAPDTPTSGSSVDNTQPMTDAGSTMADFAAAADFRSWEDRTNLVSRRVANTIARTHQAGTRIIPCFAVTDGNERDLSPMGRRTYGGFDDLITLRDAEGNDEQLRVQWGYRNWMGPVQEPVQLWKRDRPLDLNDLWRYPSASWTRVLKFPSREMPDAVLTATVNEIRFGRRFDDNAVTGGGFLDELAFLELPFPPDDRRDYAFLGAVPSQYAQTGNTGTAQMPVKFAGIDDKTDEIFVFMPFYEPATRTYVRGGLPVASEVFRADGGCVKIDDELILYSSWDPASGALGGCLRGCFLTEAKAHDYGAIVFPVETFAMSRLTEDAGENAESFTVEDALDFPEDGCIRIHDSLELVGYASVNANQLIGPVGRIDPGTDSTPGRSSEEALKGGPLFRGRFGTVATGYSEGQIAMAMPIRYYDRYAERSDDPENSYVQLSWTREGAVWKRVSWDELVPKNVEIIALVRFSGGPAWDSGEDRVVDLGSSEQVPKENRRGFLYRITDPAAENLLNVEADRIEVRLMVRFAKGAYDREATPRPNEWKDTPWIKRVLAEYVSATSVLSQE